MKTPFILCIIAAFLFASPGANADLFDQKGDDQFFDPKGDTTFFPPMETNSDQSSTQPKTHVSTRESTVSAQTLVSQMESVSDWLQQYIMQNHRFPDPGDEMNDALVQLNELVPNNPYAPSIVQTSPGIDNDPTYLVTYPLGDPNLDRRPNRIRLIFDPGLSGPQAELWVSDPPDDWSAPPGTITVLCNNQNLYVVWGAGRNGKPVRNQFDGKTELIFGRLPMLDFQ